MNIASSASSRSRQDAEVSQTTSTMGPPGRREPQASHRPAPGLSSRTPKRIKATPPSRHLGACTSTVANHSNGESRLVNGETSARCGGNAHKMPLKSPWRSPAWSSEREARRKRENTVPMLSRTLSHFSLSQTPPQMQQSPGRPEPRRGHALIPSFPSFSSDGPEPASPSVDTAPAPYTHLFLASPFARRGQDVPESSKQAQAHEAYRRWQESMPVDQAGSSLDSPTHFRHAATASTSTAASTPSVGSFVSGLAEHGSPAFKPRRPSLAMFPKHSASPTPHWYGGPPIASAPLPGPGDKAGDFFGSKPVRRATSSVDLDLEAEEFFFHSKAPSRASSHSPHQVLRRQDSDESMVSAYSSSNDETASSDPSTLPTSTFILPSPLPLLSHGNRPKLERRWQSERIPLDSPSDEDCELLDNGSPSLPPCRRTRAISDPKRMVANIFAPRLPTNEIPTASRMSAFQSTPSSETPYSRSSSIAASSACKAAPAFSPNLFSGAFETPGTMSESSTNASAPSPSPTPAKYLRTSQQGKPAVASPEHRKPISGPLRGVMPRRMTASNSGIARPSPAITSKTTVVPVSKASQIPRPNLRRGITEPQTMNRTTTPSAGAAIQIVDRSFATPPVFTDERPSPAAFASTGLIKKRGAFSLVKSSLQSGAKTKGKQTLLTSLKTCTPDTPVKTATTTPSGLIASRIPQRVQQTSSWVSSTSSTGSDATRSTSDCPSSRHSRGLRRKGSAMFPGSGGSGSWSGEIFEPMTPSRRAHGIPSPGFLTTPSPPAAMRIYPFAASPIHRSHSAMQSSPTSATSPTEAFGPRNHLLRRIQPRPGPIARASNPLLSAAYKAGAVAASGCSGGFASPSLRSPSKATTGRLERDFVVLEVLGRGEFSDVLKVEEKKGGGLWAVKRGRRFAGAKDRLRQLQEVSILRQLSLQPNTHILRYIDSWEQNEQLHIRTELVDCGDLATFLEAIGDTGGLGEARVWKMLAELSTAISLIHDHNLIHLDLKPANILVTAEGSLKIADFGLSAKTSTAGLAVAASPPLPSEGENGNFTWSSDLEVTPELEKDREGDRAYLAPEGLSEGRFGRESDIFSLGIMVLEAALNVVLPENGDGWRQLRSDDFSDIMEHYLPIEYIQSQEQDSALPQLSEALLSLIKKMMSSDPSGRPSIHEICNHPVIQRIRKHDLQSPDVPEWSDTECDEPGPSQSQSKRLSRIGNHLARPALVPESTTTLTALLRVF